MRKQFGDSSIAIEYVQQYLNENYNDNIYVSGDYYKTFDMNYGFAHFIAKYLDFMYPVLDSQTKEEYAANDGTAIRDIKQPISIANYFLCSNAGKRLKFGYSNTCIKGKESQTVQPANEQYSLYRKIYNYYMTPLFRKESEDSVSIAFEPIDKKYIVKNDLPLFVEYDGTHYSTNENTIFTLSAWNIPKEICEIDDVVASYLLGRTVTPNSSREDIYMVQKLMIHDREITQKEKGIWCMPGMEGTQFDLTQTILNYQKLRVNPLNTTPLFVTGYYDIYTEASILKEVGEDTYGIFGL